MLAPRERTLLLESLRPPPGYHLDLAVATTFSLDLMALLVAPLAFTFFDWEGEAGEPTQDPNALLEAIRRHADRIHVFCQAGQISIPNSYRLLFGYLEERVHEVRAIRKGGVFHPKVWVVRYAAEGEPPRYRLLCASRNLTFDRSWDTLLVLDGAPGREERPENEPLSRFIRALTTLCVHPFPPAGSEELEGLAREIGRVVFQPPEQVDDIGFLALGLPGGPEDWPFPEQADRALVLAPFLSEEILERLRVGPEPVLVSRLDTLDTLHKESLEGYEVLAWSEEASLEEDGEANGETGNRASMLSGLHAKLFAFDTGTTGRVWTGSANATRAAFHANVEFMVEMRGHSRLMGVEALLQPSKPGTSVLRDLLEPLPRTSPPVVDPLQQELDRRLLEYRHAIIDLALEVEAVPSGKDLYDLSILVGKAAGLPDPEGEFQLKCWPITLKQEAAAQPLSSLAVPRFRAVSFEGLTSFFAFEGHLKLDGKSESFRFVLNLPTRAFPRNRQQQLLRRLLKDRNQLLRYLFLLLAEDGTLTVSDFSNPHQDGTNTGGEAFRTGFPLLEALLGALEQSPGKLDQVHRLITDLQSTEEGRSLLPEEFEQIWRPLWAARQSLEEHGRENG